MPLAQVQTIHYWFLCCPQAGSESESLAHQSTGMSFLWSCPVSYPLLLAKLLCQCLVDDKGHANAAQLQQLHSCRRSQ